MSKTIIEKANCCQPAVRGSEPSSARAQVWRRPRYNVSESTDAFEVQVLLPGVARGQIEIDVVEDVLNIVGSRQSDADEQWKPLRREIPKGDFRLNLQLNVAINEQKIEATVSDGVLNLVLPKADEIKPRKIKIS